MKIVIFGASGDLAKRKIFPAISKLKSKNFQIYGYARTDFGGKYSNEIKKFYEYDNDFLERITYIKGEYSCLDPLKDILDEKTLVYLSLPPHVHYDVLLQLQKFNVGAIYIEKPFGENKESFDNLMKLKSDKIKFIDHYLLKPMMISISKIKEIIPEIFEQLSVSNIKSVDCLFIESILAEGRSYFDKNGIIKDVMQNHLIEMLASILCDRKSNSRIDFIKEMHIDRGEYVFGQYSTYADEVGYKSNTETLSAFKCYSKNEAWKNVPFYMVAGKGLSKKASEIRFNVKKDRHCEFSKFIENYNSDIESITVVFNIAPENQLIIEFSTPNGEQKIVILDSASIKKISESIVGERQDYEIIFDSFLRKRIFPSVSFEEADELWRVFEDILNVDKKLMYYTVGDKISTKIPTDSSI